MNEVTKAIIELREEKKLTQEDIANILGQDRSSYSRLEKRGKKLSLEQIESIAEALKVDVTEILKRTYNKPIAEDLHTLVKKLLDTSEEQRQLLYRLYDKPDYNLLLIEDITTILFLQLIFDSKIGDVRAINSDLKILGQIEIRSLKSNDSIGLLWNLVYSTEGKFHFLEYDFSDDERSLLLNLLMDTNNVISLVLQMVFNTTYYPSSLKDVAVEYIRFDAAMRRRERITLLKKELETPK